MSEKENKITEVKESIIGKKYKPNDNSWSLNLTKSVNSTNRGNRIVRGYLGGTYVTDSVICKIKSEPFEMQIQALDRNPYPVTMVIVEYKKNTYIVLFNESNIIE